MDNLFSSCAGDAEFSERTYFRDDRVCCSVVTGWAVCECMVRMRRGQKIVRWWAVDVCVCVEKSAETTVGL